MAGSAPRTRRNVYKLTAGGPELSNYAKGITAMQSRDASDPTSWSFWAAMHGTYTTPSNPLETELWNHCQHGCWFFLSWHRMYIYFLEEMIRAACGDATFGLPYWNYSDGWPQWAALPPPFQAPPKGTPPLYVSDRDPGINDGTAILDEVDTNYAHDYLITVFYRPVDGGFGGGPPSDDPHMNSDYGQLELRPHNVVHGDVGGWMGDPNTAAQDPIFWLHHSNIDRLWEGWLQTCKNPTEGDWLDAPYPFIDTAGTKFEITIKEFMAQFQPNVSYDELPSPPVAEERRAVTVSPNGLRTIAATTQESVPLAGEPVVVAIPLTDDARRLIADRPAAPGEGPAVALQVEGIEFHESPPGPYHIYVNLPPGEEATFRSPHFVGSITFFGHAHHPGGPRSVGPHRFDITGLIGLLQERGLWNGDQMELTLVPGGPVSPGGEERARRSAALADAWQAAGASVRRFSILAG